MTVFTPQSEPKSHATNLEIIIVGALSISLSGLQTTEGYLSILVVEGNIVPHYLAVTGSNISA